jgi:hypothetical protein
MTSITINLTIDVENTQLGKCMYITSVYVPELNVLDALDESDEQDKLPFVPYNEINSGEQKEYPFRSTVNLSTENETEYVYVSYLINDGFMKKICLPKDIFTNKDECISYCKTLMFSKQKESKSFTDNYITGYMKLRFDDILFNNNIIFV